MEEQVTESAYVWTNSKNIHLEWDPDALYFDARDNQHYGKMVNDSWSDEGKNCMIKWNERRRRAEVWTVVDVPLYKELGAAYNDPYWYRTNNGILTRAQAVQIRDYYNMSELPPYANSAVEANIPESSPEPISAHATEQQAPNISIISIDEDTVDVPTPQETAAKAFVEEEEWKQDAITMTEAEYIMKYYSDKAEDSNSGIPMDMYFGLCTDQVISISLLLAMADAQLQKK